MNAVFVDTSAFLALLIANDEAHESAKAVFATLQTRRARLVTTSYVLVETYALLGRRLGTAAVRAFREDFAPLLEVVWVDRELHEAALDELLERAARTLSLVDATSFVVMRRRRIEEAFVFDRHFTQAGFTLVR